MNKKYEIRYLPTFINQFNEILYYINFTLNNPIVAREFRELVIKRIEKRSKSPEAFEVIRIINNVKYYKINIKKFMVLSTVKKNEMVIRRIYYSPRNLEKLF